MKLRALALSLLFAAGCHSPKVVTEVPPFLTVKASKPPKKKRPVRHAVPTSVHPSVWTRLAKCESGGRWSIHNPPYEGGLQHNSGTWDAYRDSNDPDCACDASPAVQIKVADRVRKAQGWAAWPKCSIVIGVAK